MPTPDPYRDQFAADLGEEKAAAIEAAAQIHVEEMGEIHADDDKGNSPFLYAVLTVIGRQCWNYPTGNASHQGIPTEEKLQNWCKDGNKLGEYTGQPPDYLALLVGAYEPFFTEEYLNQMRDEEKSDATADAE